MRTTTEREEEFIDRYSRHLLTASALIVALGFIAAYIIKGIDGVGALIIIAILSVVMSYFV